MENDCTHENTTIVEVLDMDDAEVCDNCGKVLNEDWPTL